jgi:hypothetical protein
VVEVQNNLLLCSAINTSDSERCINKCVGKTTTLSDASLCDFSDPFGMTNGVTKFGRIRFGSCHWIISYTCGNLRVEPMLVLLVVSLAR